MYGNSMRMDCADSGGSYGVNTAVYGFSRQPRATSAVAVANAASATTAVRPSESATGVSWTPVRSARVASTR